MTIQTKAVLKTYFEQGDIPTEGQYKNLIDSSFNLGETETQIIQGTLSASAAEIESMTFKKLHLPGNGIGSMKVASTFRIGRTFEVSGSINVTHGDITITSSGQFSGENATITNISGSYISASGHIYSAGNISASGHISGSATSTGSFGRVEVATRIERHNDPNTAVKFASDTVTIVANNYQGAKFGSSAGVSVGNTSFAANITGSTVGVKGNITASNASLSILRTSEVFTASAGGLLSFENAKTTTWESTAEIPASTWGRSFQITISSLPTITAKNNFADEYMTLTNPNILLTSNVICNQATIGNSAGTYALMSVQNIVDGRFTIIPYTSTGDGTAVIAGGTATYNFTII